MAAKNPRWPPRNLVFYISTSDRCDFPRIIEIALFLFYCTQYYRKYISLVKVALIMNVFLSYLRFRLENRYLRVTIFYSKVWIEEEKQVLHEYYAKPMKSKAVMSQKSAMPLKGKQKFITQEIH